MQIVPRGDEYAIGLLVVKQATVIGRGIRESELRGRILCADPAGCGHACQSHSFRALQYGNQHSTSKVARPDEADTVLTGGASGRLPIHEDAGVFPERLLDIAVLEQDSASETARPVGAGILIRFRAAATCVRRDA